MAFDFLTFDELHTCTRVCKEWLAIACSMRGLNSGKHVSEQLDSTLLFSSCLSRHVSSLVHHCASMWHYPKQQLACIVASCPLLRELDLRLLPSGTSKSGHLFRWPADLHTMQLPASLRTVSVRFSGEGEIATSDANAFIRLMGSHTPLRNLELVFEPKMPEGIAFTAAAREKACVAVPPASER